MYLTGYIFCTVHLFLLLQFCSVVCVDRSCTNQHLSTYKVIYFVLVMQLGDISIKNIYLKWHLMANRWFKFWQQWTHAQSLTQTHAMAETKIHTSHQRKTAATESAIPGKRKKEVVLLPEGIVGTETCRHQSKRRYKQKMTRGKDYTYHTRCHRFLYKHNRHSPMWFPRSSAQSSMEYPLREMTCISRFNYLQAEVALRVCTVAATTLDCYIITHILV